MVEWQIFRNTETTEKSQKLSTKRKSQKTSLFLGYFKFKFIIQNLRLVKLV